VTDAAVMQAVLDRICAFSAAGAYGPMLDYIRTQRLPAAILFQFIHLMAQKQAHVLGATQIARAVGMSGLSHWPALVLAALDSFRSGDVADGYRHVANLRTSPDLPGEVSSSERAELTDHPVVRLAIIALLDLWKGGHQALAQGVLEILKILLGELRQLMDGPLRQAHFLDQPGPAPLLSFPSPKPGQANHGRRVVLGMRELMFPERPTSRKADMPMRIVASMRAYGWDVDFLPLGMIADRGDMAEILAELARRCREARTDMLILDMETWDCPPSLLAQLRASTPGTTLVLIYLDPWKLEFHDRIRAFSPHVDAFWSVNPSLPLWREPGIKDRAIFFPWLNGNYGEQPASPGPLALGFTGGVEAYNWTRAAWLIQAEADGLAIATALSSHHAEEMDALTSFHAYLDRLAVHTANLNFSLRLDFGRTLTARVFEALSAHSLLIQEATPDMDYYLVRGRDYLCFESFADLRTVQRFIHTKPDAANRIRENGFRMMRTVYADQAIVGYFDRFIEDGVPPPLRARRIGRP
jgi:hypothetical protein